MKSIDNEMSAAEATALSRWRQPCADFASGQDPRTSDEGLLRLTYGGLVHAARFDWLNAGRRLIDKTYVDMLWHVQELTGMRTVQPAAIAAALDGFIVDTVRPAWHDLPRLSAEDGLAVSIDWTEQMARRCFGSLHSELAASRLMFFLLPMLPVFNLSRGHLAALDRVGHPSADAGYRAFAQAAMSAYREHFSEPGRFTPPPVSARDPQQAELVRDLLAQTDWWPRRVFDAYLRRIAIGNGTDRGELFACDDAGMPVADEALSTHPALPQRRNPEMR
jgi:hypothetical protein